MDLLPVCSPDVEGEFIAAYGEIEISHYEIQQLSISDQFQCALIKIAMQKGMPAIRVSDNEFRLHPDYSYERFSYLTENRTEIVWELKKENIT